jgi:hypothetical protein
MIQLDRAAAITLARNILGNVTAGEGYLLGLTDEQLNDIGTRAVYWVQQMVRSFQPTEDERHPELYPDSLKP